MNRPCPHTNTTTYGPQHRYPGTHCKDCGMKVAPTIDPREAVIRDRNSLALWANGQAVFTLQEIAEMIRRLDENLQACEL